MYEYLIYELRDSADWADHLAILMGRVDGDVHAPIMRKAADAIEELMRRCEQFQYMPPPAWVPVTEQLPKIGENVLVFAYGRDVFVGRMEHQLENGRRVFECNGGSGIFLEMAKPGRITHWMPLPSTEGLNET